MRTQRTNINDEVGSLYPQGLCQAVVNHGADIGFGFDGDGDRGYCCNVSRTRHGRRPTYWMFGSNPRGTRSRRHRHV